MIFEIKNLGRSINDIMRQIGYSPTYLQKEGKFSMVKMLARIDYPRFHLYVNEIENGFSFDLHLDQKKPSYEGSKSHSGEYEGDVVEGEVGRIKDILA